MKKVMIVLLTLSVIAAGVFFWKGGHHALAMAEILEEWLDADNADQLLTVQVQTPGFETDASTGRIEPKVRQWSLSGDSFWTEYADRRIFGLCVQGITAYTDGRTLCMDSGQAYSLPELSVLRQKAERLVMGLLLHGRVTKSGDTYRLVMDTDELELDVSVTADQVVQAASVIAIMHDGTAVRISLTAKEPTLHPIPLEISDTMVHSVMEPPMSIMEPLEVLLPAFENLLPLEGDLDLGISCGILELSETVRLAVSDGNATITRDGIIIDLTLPGEVSELSPAAAALLLLRDGQFTLKEDTADLSVSLSGDTTSALLEALVPQAAGLGITLESSTLSLQIHDGRLASAAISADGAVPFLITTIPVTFSAVLMPSQ